MGCRHLLSRALLQPEVVLSAAQRQRATAAAALMVLRRPARLATATPGLQHLVGRCCGASPEGTHCPLRRTRLRQSESRQAASAPAGHAAAAARSPRAAEHMNRAALTGLTSDDERQTTIYGRYQAWSSFCCARLTGSSRCAFIESTIHSGRTTGLGFLQSGVQPFRCSCVLISGAIDRMTSVHELSLWWCSPLALENFDFGIREIAADDVCDCVSAVVVDEAAAMQRHDLFQLLHRKGKAPDNAEQ